VNTHPHQPHHLLHLPSPFQPPHNPSPGQPARHVLAAARVTFHHLVGELKASVGDLWH
ncbi:hypothetical protein N320_09588, partial [Buceros rhinoceros silvestris]